MFGVKRFGWKKLLFLLFAYTFWVWNTSCSTHGPAPNDITSAGRFTELTCKNGFQLYQLIEQNLIPHWYKFDAKYDVSLRYYDFVDNLDSKYQIRTHAATVKYHADIYWTKSRFYLELLKVKVEYYVNILDAWAKPYYNRVITQANRFYWVTVDPQIKNLKQRFFPNSINVGDESAGFWLLITSWVDKLNTKTAPLVAEDNPEPEPIDLVAPVEVVEERDEYDDVEIAPDSTPESLDLNEDEEWYEDETVQVVQTVTVTQSDTESVEGTTSLTSAESETPAASVKVETIIETVDGTKVIRERHVPVEVETVKLETYNTDSDLVETHQYVDQLLNYFAVKVNKTLELATESLLSEMEPHLQDLLDEVKPKALKLLQQFNAKIMTTYKRLNEMLIEIGKDYEAILELNDAEYPELVSRQQFRDKIAEAYQIAEDMGREVTALMAPAHTRIVKQYFKVLQETIDVIDLFADSTVQDFHRQLSAALEAASAQAPQDVDQWQAWKQFHRTKELIFEYRDYLYDTFVEYRDTKGRAQVVVGLDAWLDYVLQIDFSVNTLGNDNDQYLQLVRAKGNVQFQMREGLVSKILEEAAAQPEEIADSNETETNADPLGDLGDDADIEIDESVNDNIDVDELEQVEVGVDDEALNADDAEIELETH